MKLKLFVFSSLFLLALGSCRQGVKLPSQVTVAISGPGNLSRVSDGSYISHWNLDKVTDVFKTKLKKYLKRNRVTIEDGGFANTPYRLVIDKVVVTQTESPRYHYGNFNCPSQTVYLDQVNISVAISLQKDGVPIGHWNFSESCEETEGSRKKDKDDPDSCTEYCDRRMLFFSLRKMIKRCAKQARVHISQKIYDTDF